MRELIESAIRSEVIESGRGKYIEGSLRMDRQSYYDGYSTWYVRFMVRQCNQRELWYGAEFSANGERISPRLFN